MNAGEPMAPVPVTLVLTDFGSESCGVGHTMWSWAESHLDAYQVIDPRASLRTLLAAVRRLGPGPIVLAYPTRSGRGSPKTVLLLLALRLRRREVAVHLHEYGRARRIHRVYMRICLSLTTGVVVVSTRGEARHIERRVQSWRRVEVCPAPAGCLPLQPEIDAARDDGSPRAVVGVFGIPRANKGLERIWSWLDGVATDRPIALELVGTGWEPSLVPAGRSFSSSVRVLGHVPREELPAVFAGWDVAVAPFSEGATDGRNSLRTPCAGGVPAVTVMPPEPADLTFRPPLGLHDIERTGHLGSVILDEAARRQLSRWTNDFDRRARERLVQLLVGTVPPER